MGKRNAPPVSTLVTAAILVCAWAAFGTLIEPAALSHDFLNLYTGASLARDGRFTELHSAQVQLAREREYRPQTPVLIPFVRPHVYALALSPLASLPYVQAFQVWRTLQWVILIACWAWAWRRFGGDAILWGALSLPAGLGIAHGQDAPLLLAIAVAGYAMAERDRPLAAGLLWSLGLVKFHLFLLFPLSMLAARKWRCLAGFSIGGMVLSGASLLLGGGTGAANYVDLLLRKDLDRLSPDPEKMFNLQSIAANFQLPSWTAIAAAGVILAGFLFLAARRELPLWHWTALTIALNLVTAPHVYGYDATLLLLPLWLVIHHSANGLARIPAAFMAAPLVPMLGMAPKPWSAIPALTLAALSGLLGSEALSFRGRSAVQDNAREGRLPNLGQVTVE